MHGCKLDTCVLVEVTIGTSHVENKYNCIARNIRYSIHLVNGPPSFCFPLMAIFKGGCWSGN